MRAKRVNQRGLDFSKSHLSITKKYYAKYQAVSTVLDQAPKLVDLIHRDLVKTLKNVNREGRCRGRRYTYTSEHVLRILICQVVEGDSLRGIVVRIDEDFRCVAHKLKSNTSNVSFCHLGGCAVPSGTFSPSRAVNGRMFDDDKGTTGF